MGTAYSAGIYSGTRTAKDGIFSGTNNFAMGLRIDGLQAGDYTLYYTARNTNTINASPMRVFAGAGSSSSTYTFSTETNFSDVTNAYAATNSSFILGQNYNTITVSIEEGDSLFLAVDGNGGSGNERGFLNSVQIVPESSATLLLAMGGFALILRRKGSPEGPGLIIGPPFGAHLARGPDPPKTVSAIVFASQRENPAGKRIFLRTSHTHERSV